MWSRHMPLRQITVLRALVLRKSRGRRQGPWGCRSIGALTYAQKDLLQQVRRGPNSHCPGLCTRGELHQDKAVPGLQPSPCGFRGRQLGVG